jgi:hypothetical protein
MRTGRCDLRSIDERLASVIVQVAGRSRIGSIERDEQRPARAPLLGGHLRGDAAPGVSRGHAGYRDPPGRQATLSAPLGEDSFGVTAAAAAEEAAIRRSGERYV